MGARATSALETSLSARLLGDKVKDPDYKGPSDDHIFIEAQRVDMLIGTNVVVDITASDDVGCQFASNFNTTKIAEDLIKAWRALGIQIPHLTVIVRASGCIAWGQAV